MKDMVVGFLFSPDFSEVLLIRKNRPDWQAGLLNGVGGKIEEEDESPVHALVREFEEETGIVIPPAQWREYFELKFGPDQAAVHFFATQWRQDDWNLLPDNPKAKEDEPVEIVNITDYSSVISNLVWLIPMGKWSLWHSEWVCGVGYES